MVVYFICGPGCPMSYDEVEKTAKRLKLELVGEHTERRFAEDFQAAEKDRWMVRTVWGIEFGNQYDFDLDGQFYHKAENGEKTPLGFCSVLQIDEGPGHHPPAFVQSKEKRFFKASFVIRERKG